MEEVKKPTKLLRYSAYILGVIMIVSVGNILFEWVSWGCHYDKGAQYYMDSPCFNMTFRCETECRHYGLSYSGNTEGCVCLCESDFAVSSCSGSIINTSNDSPYWDGSVKDELEAYLNEK